MIKLPIHSIKKLYLGITFLFVGVLALSQGKTDSLSTPYHSFYDADTSHSAKKAAIYSAILPGLGQAYNRKFWKIPLVYGAIGGCLTAALINNRDFQITRKDLFLRESGNLIGRNPKYERYQDAQLLALSDEYRKWRDNMFIFTGVAYALNIIDANVDAHLFNFDVSQDLSLNWQPYTYSWEIRKPVAGISFTLRFK